MTVLVVQNPLNVLFDVSVLQSFIVSLVKATLVGKFLPLSLTQAVLSFLPSLIKASLGFGLEHLLEFCLTALGVSHDLVGDKMGRLSPERGVLLIHREGAFCLQKLVCFGPVAIQRSLPLLLNCLVV